MLGVSTGPCAGRRCDLLGRERLEVREDGHILAASTMGERTTRDGRTRLRVSQFEGVRARDRPEACGHDKQEAAQLDQRRN